MRLRSFQIVLFVLLCVCAPVMAATVTITDNGYGYTVILTTEAGEANIMAAALDIEVDSGAVVLDVSIDTPNFNIYPDSAYVLGAGYTYGAGTPVCTINAPGEIALPQSSFAVCFANLNGAAVAGADGAASVQFTLTMDYPETICISENALRGGIVAVDGSSLDISGGEVCDICFWCICDYTGPDWDEAVAVGCPSSWLSASQCHGDADGQNEQVGKASYAVGFNDINIMLNGFNKAYSGDPGVDWWIAADFDHHAEQIGKGFYRVGFNDINILLAWFNTPGVPSDCGDANPVSP